MNSCYCCGVSFTGCHALSKPSHNRLLQSLEKSLQPSFNLALALLRHGEKLNHALWFLLVSVKTRERNRFIVITVSFLRRVFRSNLIEGHPCPPRADLERTRLTSPVAGRLSTAPADWLRVINYDGNSNGSSVYFRKIYQT